jgi:hypothetical protein
MNKNQNNYVQLANTFFGKKGQQSAFPRNIEQAILWNFPVAIINLPRLGLSLIKRWLEIEIYQCHLLGKTAVFVRVCSHDAGMD